MRIPIRVGGWGEIDECVLCGKKECGGVIPYPEGVWDYGDEVCNKCLKKKCTEIKREGQKRTKVLVCDSFDHYARMWNWCFFIMMLSKGDFDYQLNYELGQITLIQYKD